MKLADYRVLDKQIHRQIVSCTQPNEKEELKVDPDEHISDNLKMIRINGMSRCWEEQKCELLHRRIENAIAGYCTDSAKFMFLIASDGVETGFYLGSADETATNALAGVVRGTLLDVGFSNDVTNNGTAGIVYSLDELMARYSPDSSGGMIDGMPAVPMEKAAYLDPAYILASGMQGEKYCVAFVCRAVPQSTVQMELQYLQEQKNIVTSDLQNSVTRASGDTVTMTNYVCKEYFNNLELLEKHLMASCSIGAWQVCGYYLAETAAGKARLEALIRSAYHGEGDLAGPELLRCFNTSHAYSYISRSTLVPVPMNKDKNWYFTDHPLNPLSAALTSRSPDVRRLNELTPFNRPFHTQLSSRQLASLLMLPDRELPGFFVNEPSRFDVTSRVRLNDNDALSLGDIRLSANSSSIAGEYRFPWLDLSRHVLVTGATGGGKSNTIRSMLKELYTGHHVPFMVIESAKSEYWELAGFSCFRQRLYVMSLGEMSSPFRLNPFECEKGFSLQTHVDSLLSTFKAAFEMYTPMPFILEQAVYEVYADYGWDIATGRNSRGRIQYPTLSDLYWQIPETVAHTAYDKEIKDNVTGALQTRVRSLMVGGKGQMMNCRLSTPLDELLSKPSVLELENLGDDETKAFVMGLLMNRLYEFRRVKSAGRSRDFMHLLIIEEAHRLLKNVPPSQDNTRAASVEFFCNMLAEIRSYGQGMLIADQSPEKLAPDCLRNTNLKIVHRMVDKNDRAAVGGAMHMTDEQTEAVTMLGRGVAAVYAEGDHRPKLVKFPIVKPSRSVDRDSLLVWTNEALLGRNADTGSPYHPGCLMCPHYRDGRCSSSTYGRQNRDIASMKSVAYPDLQKKDYEQRYEEMGPNPSLTDAIALFAVRKSLSDRHLSEEALAEQINNCPGNDRLCIAGFTVSRLKLPTGCSAELIMDRYANHLYRLGLMEAK